MKPLSCRDWVQQTGTCLLLLLRVHVAPCLCFLVPTLPRLYIAPSRWTALVCCPVSTLSRFHGVSAVYVAPAICCLCPGSMLSRLYVTMALCRHGSVLWRLCVVTALFYPPTAENVRMFVAWRLTAPQWSTADAEIKVSSAENRELSKVFSLNIVLGENRLFDLACNTYSRDFFPLPYKFLTSGFFQLLFFSE